MPTRRHDIFRMGTLLLLSSLVSTMTSAAELIRIACVGDSITEGTVLSHSATEAWPAVLQGLLGTSVLVENFGRGGATACVAGDTPYVHSPQASAAFASQPDMVIIMLGTNDARSANSERHQAFACDLAALGRRFAALPSAPLIVLCTPLVGFKSSLSVDPAVIENELAPAVRSVAALEGWPLIDTNRLLASLGPSCADGIHPDAAGTARIASVISAAFKSLKIVCAEAPPSRLARRLAQGQAAHLLVYGTSLTAGGAWPEQVHQLIEARYPGKLTLTNSGAGGKWSQWGLENLDERVIAKAPDTVLIEFGINDAFLTYATSVEQARRNLELMMARIRKTLPACEIILMTMNQPTLSHAEDRPKFSDYMTMYRSIATTQHVPLIDLLPGWQRLYHADSPTWNALVPDGIHPNADGNARMTTPGIMHALFGRVSTK